MAVVSQSLSRSVHGLSRRLAWPWRGLSMDQRAWFPTGLPSSSQYTASWIHMTHELEQGVEGNTFYNLNTISIGCPRWPRLSGKICLPMKGPQETRVWPLGEEDPPEETIAKPLQYFCVGNPMDRGAWDGSQRVGHNWAHTEANNQYKARSWSVHDYIKTESHVCQREWPLSY